MKLEAWKGWIDGNKANFHKLVNNKRKDGTKLSKKRCCSHYVPFSPWAITETRTDTNKA